MEAGGKKVQPKPVVKNKPDTTKQAAAEKAAKDKKIRDEQAAAKAKVAVPSEAEKIAKQKKIDE